MFATRHSIWLLSTLLLIYMIPPSLTHKLLWKSKNWQSLILMSNDTWSGLRSISLLIQKCHFGSSRSANHILVFRLGYNKRLQPWYFRQFVWAIKSLLELVSASVLREMDWNYWLEKACPLEKTHSTTGSENTRPVTPDAESVVSSGMLTTIELFYLPIF